MEININIFFFLLCYATRHNITLIHPSVHMLVWTCDSNGSRQYSLWFNALYYQNHKLEGNYKDWNGSTFCVGGGWLLLCFIKYDESCSRDRVLWVTFKAPCFLNWKYLDYGRSTYWEWLCMPVPVGQGDKLLLPDCNFSNWKLRAVDTLKEGQPCCWETAKHCLSGGGGGESDILGFQVNNEVILSQERWYAVE